MRSKIIQNILSNTSLETKIMVQLEMGAIDLITQLGYRESKPWDESESEILVKIREWAKSETNWLIKKIENDKSRNHSES